jgi:hypothetical protein
VKYVPHHRLGGQAHVVVDGSATEGTVLTISHWPQSPTPPGLGADLSAEMAFAFLDRPDLPHPAAVTNNHFDQDGLVGVYALVDPAAAFAQRDPLIDIASAGDFATYRTRGAATISMTIAAFADPERSPLGRAPDDYAEWAATLYDDMLGRLPELLGDPSGHRDLWADELATLDVSEALVQSGQVRIEETPALDLAVVHIPEDAPMAGGHRFGGSWASGLHPMAINNATDRFVVLSLRGRRYELACRYETWVQFRSRRPRARVDLRPLADALTAEETTGTSWVADGPEALTPALRIAHDGESSLAPAVMRERVEAYLATAPNEWDPYPSDRVGQL